jgi:hypothetical protein
MAIPSRNGQPGDQDNALGLHRHSLAELLPRVIDADLCRPTDAPDAFLHEEPSYVTWTAKIHRAPSAT